MGHPRGLIKARNADTPWMAEAIRPQRRLLLGRSWMTTVSLLAYVASFAASSFPFGRFWFGGFQVHPAYLFLMPMMIGTLLAGRGLCKAESAVGIYAFVFVLSILTTSLFSGGTWSSTAFKWVVSLTSLFVLVRALSNDKAVIWTSTVACASVCFICAYALGIFAITDRTNVLAFGDVHGNRNTLSLWTVGLIPGALSAGLRRAASMRERVFWWGLTSIIVVAQLLTLNRSSWLVMGVVIPLTFGRHRFRLSVLLGALCLLGGLFLAVWLLPPSQLNALAARLQELRLWEVPNSADAFRLAMVRRAWDLGWRSPLFGIGLGVFEQGWLMGRDTVAHNIYALTFAEQGLFGSVVLGWGLVWTSKQVLLKRKRGEESLVGAIGRGGSIGLLALILRGLFSDGVFFTPVAPLVAALAIYDARRVTRRKSRGTSITSASPVATTPEADRHRSHLKSPA